MKCGNCNREIGEETSCPYCGFDNAPSMAADKKRNKNKNRNRTKPVKTGSGGGGNSKLLLQVGLLGVIMIVIVFGGMSLFSSLQNASGNSGNQASAGNASGVLNNGETLGSGTETPAAQTILVSEYKIHQADVSWEEAAERCYAEGGNLAVVTSEEEFNEICQLAEKSGLDYIWLGASLNNCSKWEESNCCITGEEWTYSKWYPGEPSYEDSSDGVKEAYLCLWKAKKDGTDIGWTMNDQRNDLVGAFSYVSGKVGYICEITSEQEVAVEQTQAADGDYMIADSNSRYVTEAELDKMAAADIRIARNEIYARHGRKFDSEDLQSYFNSKSWYKGTIDAASFDEGVLNEYEKANAKFMREYEQKKGYI